jgi:hypothetical protein
VCDQATARQGLSQEKQDRFKTSEINQSGVSDTTLILLFHCALSVLSLLTKLIISFRDFTSPFTSTSTPHVPNNRKAHFSQYISLCRSDSTQISTLPPTSNSNPLPYQKISTTPTPSTCPYLSKSPAPILQSIKPPILHDDSAPASFPWKHLVYIRQKIRINLKKKKIFSAVAPSLLRK